MQKVGKPMTCKPSENEEAPIKWTYINFWERKEDMLPKDIVQSVLEIKHSWLILSSLPNLCSLALRPWSRGSLHFLKVKWKRGVPGLVPSWIVKNSPWPSGCWVSDMIEGISSRWRHRLFSTLDPLRSRTSNNLQTPLCLYTSTDTVVKNPRTQGWG